MSDVREVFKAQALPSWKRAVLKVGSSLLAGSDKLPSEDGLDPRYAAVLARFIIESRAQGREIVLVSSGAVAAGRRRIESTNSGPIQRQALAALGQATLVTFWQRLTGIPAAQVLLSHDDMLNRRRYLNARNTLRELLRVGALPIVNENDTVAIDKLRLGDNDNIGAAVASLVDADMLMIATDIGGLYTAHPKYEPAAQPILKLDKITDEVLAAASGDPGELGTGGMLTKLEAASKASRAGIPTVLFCGRDADVIRALTDGRLHGTLVTPESDPLTARKQWLRHAPSCGSLVVDSGASNAVQRRGASLLPGGVVRVDGEFRRGDVVEVVGESRHGPALARGLAQYGSADMRRIVRRHSNEIESVLGFSFGESVIHRDDLVLLNPEENA